MLIRLPRGGDAGVARDCESNPHFNTYTLSRRPVHPFASASLYNSWLGFGPGRAPDAVYAAPGVPAARGELRRAYEPLRWEVVRDIYCFGTAHIANATRGATAPWNVAGADDRRDWTSGANNFN